MSEITNEVERRQKPAGCAGGKGNGLPEGMDAAAQIEFYRQLAFQDPLTGLLNRRGFDEELRRLWTGPESDAFPLGLLIIDVDHFKAINDSFGHFVGDEVLKACARLMQASVRESDRVCRYYGGDEMVVVLAQADMAETRRIAERMVAAFREASIRLESLELRVTISVGACAVDRASEPTADRFLILADRALYRAKQNGRDRVCFADEMPEPLAEPVEVEMTLAPAGMADARRTVLLVDDDGEFCAVGKRMLLAQNHRVFCASTGAEAREIVERAGGTVDVALVDLRLGDEDGLALLTELRKLDDTLIGIALTGGATVEDAIGAIRLGAYDFIHKPVESGTLGAVLERAMQYRRALLENKRYQRHLEDMVHEKSAALSRALDNISDTYQFTLEAITDILDARELQTGEHSRRVARMTIVLAREMGVSPEAIPTIETGALLHDIGKIGVPDAVLLKRGPLTPEERAVMDRHPHIGYNIIKAGPGLEEISEIVLAHHERFDGSGYPRGLRGDDICLGARIFGVIDTYDAMRADRPYSRGRPMREALAEIQRHRGRLFDPVVVAAFERCLGDIEKTARFSTG